MTSKKERRKRKRHAEREMAVAWEALASGNPILAERASRRAIAEGRVNPRLWREHGVILWRCGLDGEGEQALRNAIALAPTYAAAFADLAELQAAHGKFAAAARLQQRVVELRPDSVVDRERWQELRARAPIEAAEPVAAPPVSMAFTERTGRFDWAAIEADLRARGCALLSGLLSPEECAHLLACWDDDDAFAFVTSTGAVETRVWRDPPPDPIPELRAEVYARALPIATTFARELGRRTDGWRSAEAGALERYAGGSGRTLRWPAPVSAFPLTLEIDLGPLTGDAGFVVLDVRSGRREHARELRTHLGDGVFACAAERPVLIGGVPARQPVQLGWQVRDDGHRVISVVVLPGREAHLQS